MSESTQDKGFEGLACYQHALKLLEAAYALASKLPAHEKYNLADQLRRAALSTLANIAEGYGRYHYLDRIRFFYFARGSLCETLSHFISANRVGYIGDDQLSWVRTTETEAEKSLNGYVAFIRKQQQGSNEYGHKLLHEDRVIYAVDRDDVSPASPNPRSLVPDP